MHEARPYERSNAGVREARPYERSNAGVHEARPYERSNAGVPEVRSEERQVGAWLVHARMPPCLCASVVQRFVMGAATRTGRSRQRQQADS